ncbi:MAG: YdcF family protein [Ruminococcaceae bacterium]|nr:YdcF family protein [Oscillospiraceae bacterium]
MANIIKMVIVWALAGLFTLSSLVTILRSNYNFGTVLMWLFSAVFIVYGIFHRQIDAFCAHGFGRVLKYIVYAGVALFVVLFVFVAVSGHTGGAQGNEKAYIVLGAGIRGEKVGDVLRRRLDAALEAWQKNPDALIVVTGGQGPQETITEALAQQRWLLERGVPEDKIVLEDKSESTEENLSFSRRLLAERGIAADEPVGVVTNAFHCYRAGQYAQKLGFTNVRTVPASMNLATLLPSYAREVFAILFMWVFR